MFFDYPTPKILTESSEDETTAYNLAYRIAFSKSLMENRDDDFKYKLMRDFDNELH